MPGVRVHTNGDKTVWIVTDMSGTLNVRTRTVSVLGRPVRDTTSRESIMRDVVCLEANRANQHEICLSHELRLNAHCASRAGQTMSRWANLLPRNGSVWRGQ